jgi:hypothetical protein
VTRKPRPMFPGAVTLAGAALIFEGDGRPALYLCAYSGAASPLIFRTPEDASVTAHLPHPLPTADKKKRVFLPAGSCVVFETPDARAVLELHAVRAAREVLEALEAYGQARQGAA